MKRKITVLTVLVLALWTVPIGAPAVECPSVSGTAVFNFLDSSGVARLRHGGQQVFVPITGVDFSINNGFVTRVTSWVFPGGTVQMTEQYELMAVGPNFRFDSTVKVTEGGSGDLTWSVNSIPRVGLNTIRQIGGEVCLDP